MILLEDLSVFFQKMSATLQNIYSYFYLVINQPITFC